ncbi:hypothetical protein GLAREA_04510 [Glarea lozoyensis ATCC 20868]|uniref:BTB domain-containing protein n=1 Tax=Glarea lozoyensis (strain ATCC 20868 / MF5171) TaxID=1116229 RepID=S3CRK3_GLAL2|nr:uncharacterized protein GLAREA_04510 [Glarea lozoyensis ATCC 20868]EPE27719.1 hypothetical protein GLAREA_04510 [Glarea lozoyensis ATCC 20868]
MFSQKDDKKKVNESVNVVDEKVAVKTPQPVVNLTAEQRFTTTLLPQYLSRPVTIRIVARLTEHLDQGVDACGNVKPPAIFEALDYEGKVHPELPVDFAVPSTLLKEHSEYFRSLLKSDDLQDGLVHAPIEIAIIPGTLSRKSVETMLTYLFRGSIAFAFQGTERYVSSLLELAKLAEHWGIRGCGDMFGKSIDDIITDTIHRAIMVGHKPRQLMPVLGSIYGDYLNQKVPNTQYLTPEHLDTVFSLKSHPKVRELFILAAVESHICRYMSDPYRAKILSFPNVKSSLDEHAHKVLTSSLRIELVQPKIPEGCLSVADVPSGDLLFLDPYSKKLVKWKMVDKYKSSYQKLPSDW